MVAGRIDALPFVIRYQKETHIDNKNEIALDLGEEIALVFAYIDDMIRLKLVLSFHGLTFSK